MRTPKNIRDIAEYFRNFQPNDNLKSLGNVSVYGDGIDAYYRLYNTIIATKNFANGKIVFNFGGWFTSTTNNHLSKIANIEPKLNYQRGWAWYEKNNINKFEVNPIGGNS